MTTVNSNDTIKYVNLYKAYDSEIDSGSPATIQYDVNIIDSSKKYQVSLIRAYTDVSGMEMFNVNDVDLDVSVLISSPTPIDIKTAYLTNNNSDPLVYNMKVFLEAVNDALYAVYTTATLPTSFFKVNSSGLIEYWIPSTGDAKDYKLQLGEFMSKALMSLPLKGNILDTEYLEPDRYDVINPYQKTPALTDADTYKVYVQEFDTYTYCNIYNTLVFKINDVTIDQEYINFGNFTSNQTTPILTDILINRKNITDFRTEVIYNATNIRWVDVKKGTTSSYISISTYIRDRYNNLRPLKNRKGTSSAFKLAFRHSPS